MGNCKHSLEKCKLKPGFSNFPQMLLKECKRFAVRTVTKHTGKYQCDKSHQKPVTTQSHPANCNIGIVRHKILTFYVFKEIKKEA
jgi:hypothetical protein